MPKLIYLKRFFYDSSKPGGRGGLSNLPTLSDLDENFHANSNHHMPSSQPFFDASNSITRRTEETSLLSRSSNEFNHMNSQSFRLPIERKERRGGNLFDEIFFEFIRCSFRSCLPLYIRNYKTI